jgi:HlyD family secretion protein
MKVTTRSLVIIFAGLAGVAGANFAMVGGHGQAARTDAPVPAMLSVVAGPGRVEPASEEVQVSAQLGGTLRRVAVEEGDRVSAGQVIAVLENDDYRARVASAEAE